MTEQELQAIEARAAEATEAPWEGPQSIDDLHSDGAVWAAGGDIPIADLPRHVLIESDQRVINGQFIAHARQDVPALCAALRDALKENATLLHLIMQDKVSDLLLETVRDEAVRLGLKEAERMLRWRHKQAEGECRSPGRSGWAFATAMEDAMRHIAAAASAGPVAQIEERGRLRGLAEAAAIVDRVADGYPDIGMIGPSMRGVADGLRKAAKEGA